MITLLPNIERPLSSSQLSSNEILETTNKHYNHISRCYFRDHHIKNMNLNELKKNYILKYGISARVFNSIRIKIDGLVNSRITLVKENISKKRCRIWRENDRKGKKPRIPKCIIKFSEKESKIEHDQLANFIYQKNLGLDQLQKKLTIQIRRKKSISLCFGTIQRFKAQFHLEENNYDSKDAWKNDFQFYRSRSSFWVGAKCESKGNLNAQYNPKTQTFKLKLPELFKEKHLRFENVQFSDFTQPFEEVLLSGKNPVSYQITARKNKTRTGGGKEGITYYLQAQFSPPTIAQVTNSFQGAIGLDLNNEHIAAAEIDQKGNIKRFSSLSIN